jgi:hypothetical protein
MVRYLTTLSNQQLSIMIIESLSASVGAGDPYCGIDCVSISEII